MRTKIAYMWAFSVLPLSVMGLLPAQSEAAVAGVPTIAKDSLQVTAYTLNVYRKSYDVWSWTPSAEFEVNGPIPSGGQLYAEFAIPGGPPVRFDCETREVPQGSSWKTDCGGRTVPEDKASTYTGIVSFAIHLRNELAGTDATLFTGKMTVSKAHSNEHGPKVVNHFVYFVEQDWNLPIGYLFLTAEDKYEAKHPMFNVAFWHRGSTAIFEPHLFYKGQEVGKIWDGSDQVGKATCSGEVENQTSREVADSLPQKARWERVHCSFWNVRGWDKADKTDRMPGRTGVLHLLSDNPGEYEIKVLSKGHLARSIKFTVGPDGKFDNGIAAANQLGSDRVIVPVQILDGQDGQWNRMAWKTDGFYNNPLKGFTAIP